MSPLTPFFLSSTYRKYFGHLLTIVQPLSAAQTELRGRMTLCLQTALAKEGLHSIRGVLVRLCKGRQPLQLRRELKSISQRTLKIFVLETSNRSGLPEPPRVLCRAQDSMAPQLTRPSGSGQP